jgi:hypothetical protein
MRRQVPDALVDDVDDVTLGPLLKLSGEVLDQHERGAQIALQMQIPRRPRGIKRAVALEGRGVVQQKSRGNAAQHRVIQKKGNLAHFQRLNRISLNMA